MTSDKSPTAETLSEPLVEARNAAMYNGEKVVAEEAADQGQAIVLTESRVLILKTGLSATGSVNGQRVSTFEQKHITGVKLRKGPMGAAIQICVDRPEAGGPEAQPSDTVVVFSDPRKAKKCEAIATVIASTLDRPIERVEPGSRESTVPKDEVTQQTEPAPETETVEEKAEEAAEPAFIPREPVSLAEEIYSELMTPEKPSDSPLPGEAAAPVQAASQEPASAVEPAPMFVESPVEEEAEEEDNQAQFGPNPHLPKPIPRKRPTAVRALVLVALLAALVMAGMAIMRPANDSPKPHIPMQNKSDTSGDVKAMRAQLGEVDGYRHKVTTIVQSCSAEIDAMKTGLRSGDHAALSAIQLNRIDDAWRSLTELRAPAGLVDAGNRLTNALFNLKTLVAETQSSTQTDSLNTSQASQKVTAAEKAIADGFKDIEKMRAELDRKLTAARKSAEQE